jgi:hypothetical protein
MKRERNFASGHTHLIRRSDRKTNGHDSMRKAHTEWHTTHIQKGNDTVNTNAYDNPSHLRDLPRFDEAHAHLDSQIHIPDVLRLPLLNAEVNARVNQGTVAALVPFPVG